MNLFHFRISPVAGCRLPAGIVSVENLDYLEITGARDILLPFRRHFPAGFNASYR